MPEITIGNQTIPYEIKIGTGALKKSVHLVIHPEEGVKIIVPKGIELTDPDQIILAHSDRVLRQLSLIEQAKASLNIQERRFVSGETILYLGETLTLEVIPTNDNKLTTIKRDHRKVIVRLRGYLDESLRAEEIRSALHRWYVREAKNYIPPRVAQWAAQFGFTYNQVSIKENLDTRWASCSENGNLNFNSRLMMTPPKAIDYTIIHELCHLSEPHHTPAFWGMVAEYCPDYKHWLRWFRIHSIGLRL